MKRLLLAVSFLATTAHAADLTNFERILFPAWIPIPIAGAAGSRWTADATIHNPGQDSVAVYPIVVASGRGTGTIEPGTSWLMNFSHDSFFGIGDGSQDDIPGRLAYVQRDHADALVYANRLPDVDLPVVRERDLRTSTLSLPDVPLDPRFRLLLRVYDPFQTPNAQVRVRFWSIWQATNTGVSAFTSQPPQLLGERTLTLKVRPQSGDEASVEPGYAQLSFDRSTLSSVPASSNGAIAVDVEPLTAGLRFWAFITVTHNATQRVMTITRH
jgi:hypothetical protein